MAGTGPDDKSARMVYNGPYHVVHRPAMEAGCRLGD